MSQIQGGWWWWKEKKWGVVSFSDHFCYFEWWQPLLYLSLYLFSKKGFSQTYRPCSESLLELVLEPVPDELESSSSSDSSELELLLALRRDDLLDSKPATPLAPPTADGVPVPLPPVCVCTPEMCMKELSTPINKVCSIWSKRKMGEARCSKLTLFLLCLAAQLPTDVLQPPLKLRLFLGRLRSRVARFWNCTAGRRNFGILLLNRQVSCCNNTTITPRNTHMQVSCCNNTKKHPHAGLLL